MELICHRQGGAPRESSGRRERRGALPGCLGAAGIRAGCHWTETCLLKTACVLYLDRGAAVLSEPMPVLFVVPRVLSV